MMRRSVPLIFCLLPQFACLLPQCAVAESIDCDKLTHSNVPYQIEMKDAAGKVTPYQIYRQDNQKKTQYNPQDGGILKTTFQTIFPLSAVRPDGKIVTYEWSAPTDKYFFDDVDLNLRLSTTTDGKKSQEVKYKFHFIGNEKMTVASCSFEVEHYVVDFNPKAGPSKTEAWFSRGLHAALKTKNIAVRDGVPTTKSMEAVGFALNFKPFQ